MRSKLASLATIATLAIGSPGLAACGSSAKAGDSGRASTAKAGPYVPLTQQNFSATMVAAIKDLHSVQEVTTSNGREVSTIEFDNATQPLRLRITQPTPATKSSPAATVVVMVIGNDLYARKIPGKTGGKWLKYPANEANLASITSGIGKINPSDMVGGLTKGVTGFTYIGPASIDGSAVQRYQLTIKSSAMPDGASSSNLGADTAITEMIYLNSDNTLRRMVLTMPAGVGDIQVDFTKWGQPLGITAPPASDVKDQK